MKKVDKSFCERDHGSERALQRVKSSAGVLSKALTFKIHFSKTNQTFFCGIFIKCVESDIWASCIRPIFTLTFALLRHLIVLTLAELPVSRDSVEALNLQMRLHISVSSEPSDRQQWMDSHTNAHTHHSQVILSNYQAEECQWLKSLWGCRRTGLCADRADPRSPAPDRSSLPPNQKPQCTVSVLCLL